MAKYLRPEKTLLKERYSDNTIQWAGEPLDEKYTRRIIADIHLNRLAFVYVIIGALGEAKYCTCIDSIKQLFSFFAMTFAFVLIGLAYSWVISYINYKNKHSRHIF